MMTIFFFWFRVYYYYYMIFMKMQDFILYRGLSFWQTYPKEKWNACYIAITLYILMYILQLFWFSKILYGLLKALGIEKAIQ